MGEELAKKVEAPLEYGDVRSERVRDLVKIGLTVEQAYAEVGMGFDNPEDMQADVRQLIIDTWSDPD